MSPEMVKKWKWNEVYSYDPFASDIWSLGVTLYQILTWKMNFEIKETKQLLNFLRNPIFEYENI